MERSIQEMDSLLKSAEDASTLGSIAGDATEEPQVNAQFVLVPVRDALIHIRL